MSSYKFIERLGLRVFRHFNYGWSYSEPNGAGGCGSSSAGPRDVIYADELEKLLSSAPEVYGHSSSHFPGKRTPAYWGPKENGQFQDTHTALVVGVQPIRPETAKDLLRELVNAHIDEGRYGDKYTDALNRAKKLLEGE